MKRLTLTPREKAAGQVQLPGSKSIANRALLMAALCEDETRLTNVLRSDDTQRMLEALTALGVYWQELEAATELRITGCLGMWKNVSEPLFLGNAGTAMRPLTGVLAATTAHPITLTGEPRMFERPIADLVVALQQGGARIEYLGATNYPPLQIYGGLEGGDIEVSGSASSQYITALLMALPLAPKHSKLRLIGRIVSRPYIDLTIAMLRQFGIIIDVVDERTFVIRPQRYQSPQSYWVEGDASAASYWLGAGILGGGPVLIDGAGSKSLQGDIEFARVLQTLGADIDIEPERMVVRGSELRGARVDLNHVPDAAMTLAVLALFAKGTTEIRNIANWRIKETDRLAAMAKELRKVGAEVEEFADAIRITPPVQWQHAEIETYNDHRMAMCFSLLAFAPCGVTILDPDCCRKTYPDYFAEFSRVSPPLSDAI